MINVIGNLIIAFCSCDILIICFFNSISLCCPSTSQQVVHGLVSITSLIRVAFLVVGYLYWDSTTGTITNEKVAFYALDELATVFFFFIASILILFWAELYYISTENVDVFHYYVKPITYVVNFGALVAVVACSIYISDSYEDYASYVFSQFAIIAFVVYLFAALMFSYYVYVAANEIRLVPLEIVTRKERIRFLQILGFCCITALILRAIVVMYISEKDLVTVSIVSVILFFCYFFFLEFIPLFIVLVFYRVSGVYNSRYGSGAVWGSLDDHGSNENSPLTGSYYRPGLSPVRFLPKYEDHSAPEDVVNAMIARLSDSPIVYQQEYPVL